VFTNRTQRHLPITPRTRYIRAYELQACREGSAMYNAILTIDVILSRMEIIMQYKVLYLIKKSQDGNSVVLILRVDSVAAVPKFTASTGNQQCK